MGNKRFKKKIIFSAAAAAMATSMAGCNIVGGMNTGVYGPPPADASESSSTSSAVTSDDSVPEPEEETSVQTNSDDYSYEPSMNINEDVYGPPEWFEESDEPSVEESEESEGSEGSEEESG